MYWFYYIIPKDPNHPELQETRVNRIKRKAKENKLYCEVEKIDDDVHIYVKTNDSHKAVIFKLIEPANYRYSDFPDASRR